MNSGRLQDGVRTGESREEDGPLYSSKEGISKPS